MRVPALPAVFRYSFIHVCVCEHDLELRKNEYELKVHKYDNSLKVHKHDNSVKVLKEYAHTCVALFPMLPL